MSKEIDETLAALENVVNFFITNERFAINLFSG